MPKISSTIIVRRDLSMIWTPDAETDAVTTVAAAITAVVMAVMIVAVMTVMTDAATTAAVMTRRDRKESAVNAGADAGREMIFR
jgi:hypothetical protein